MHLKEFKRNFLLLVDIEPQIGTGMVNKCITIRPQESLHFLGLWCLPNSDLLFIGILFHRPHVCEMFIIPCDIAILSNSKFTVKYSSAHAMFQPLQDHSLM